ncbi:MAG TPA: GNAT family N-acetyltransferase [Candidatus Limnocylindrales bacterium]
MTGARMTIRRGTQEPDLRPVRPDELATCAAIWRVAINDYIERLNRPLIPDDLTSIMTLCEHVRATDPERFIVATRPDADAPQGERIIGFASAIVRGPSWFLTMLFVLPEEQGLGLGRTLLEGVLPPAEAGLHLGTAIDSAQPISSALYSRYGIHPRLPILNLIGELRHRDALPELPAGVTATPFESIAAGPPDGPGHRELSEAVGAIDREILGYEHAQDHRHLRLEGRRGFLYRDGAGASLGYGYGSEVGRLGPVAVLRAELLGPVLGHLLGAVRPRGAYTVWVPGSATDALTTLLAAGLRIEPFPVLLCWDRPTVDFTRYLPISTGVL